jgi:hypothetical protein
MLHFAKNDVRLLNSLEYWQWKQEFYTNYLRSNFQVENLHSSQLDLSHPIFELTASLIYSKYDILTRLLKTWDHVTELTLDK